MQELIAKNQAWLQKLANINNPHSDHVRTPVLIAHGDKPTDPPYSATILHPAHFDLAGAFTDDVPHAPLAMDKRSNDGKWIHLHGVGDKRARVYVKPGINGLHEIAGGAGDRLNGLSISGIQGDDAYDALRAHYRAARGAVSAQEAQVKQIQQHQAARAAEDAIGESPMPVERHILPLSPEQTKEYAEVHHLLHQARSARETVGGIPREILQRLDPAAYAGGVPDELVDARLSGSLNSVGKRRIGDILHGHPGGAKAEWVQKFAEDNPEDAIHVLTHSPTAQRTLLLALQAKGHKATTDPNKWQSDPLSGQDPHARILVSPGKEGLAYHAATTNRLPEQHHVIHMDRVPALMPDDEKHLSHHLLVTDTDDEAPTLEALSRAQKTWAKEYRKR